MIADHFGTVHFVSLTDGSIRHSQVVSAHIENERTFVGLCESSTELEWQLLIVLKSGRSFKLTIPKSIDLYSSDLKTLIKSRVIETGLSDINQVVAFSLPRIDFYPLDLHTGYIMCLDGGVSILYGQEVCESCRVELGKGHIIQVTLHEGIACLLDSESFLYLLDVYSHLVIKETHVAGLIGIANVPSNPDKILASFKDPRRLELLDLSTFKTLDSFSDQEGGDILVVEQVGKTACENPCFISQSQESYQLFELKGSDSVHILTQLVKAGSHDEAASLVKTHGIPLDSYYKLCVHHLTHPIGLKDSLQAIAVYLNLL